MATYALVLDGAVHNIYQNAASPNDFPAIASKLVACDDSVKVNWLYRGGVFVDPATLVPEQTTRELRQAEYFDALKVEPTDSPLTVLGDQVDKLIAQVVAIVPPEKMTPEFNELIAKIAAVKQKFPAIVEEV